MPTFTDTERIESESVQRIKRERAAAAAQDAADGGGNADGEDGLVALAFSASPRMNGGAPYSPGQARDISGSAQRQASAQKAGRIRDALDDHAQRRIVLLHELKDLVSSWSKDKRIDAEFAVEMLVCLDEVEKDQLLAVTAGAASSPIREAMAR